MERKTRLYGKLLYIAINFRIVKVEGSKRYKEVLY